MDSPVFRARDATSASLPISSEEDVIIYGNIAYSNKDNSQQAHEYIKRLEKAAKQHMRVGSACDFNTKDFEN
jgi:hypothetical protein